MLHNYDSEYVVKMNVAPPTRSPAAETEFPLCWFQGAGRDQGLKKSSDLSMEFYGLICSYLQTVVCLETKKVGQGVADESKH